MAVRPRCFVRGEYVFWGLGEIADLSEPHDRPWVRGRVSIAKACPRHRFGFCAGAAHLCIDPFPRAGAGLWSGWRANEDTPGDT